MRIPVVPAERSRLGMSTDRITAAALQIVDTEGSKALTMRRLGQALDRKVMTLYRYVPSKGALLDGVVALVRRADQPQAPPSAHRSVTRTGSRQPEWINA